MEHDNNLLTSPPTAKTLQLLARNGILDAKALTYTLKQNNHLPDRQQWHRFLDRLLRVLGSAFLISGIVFALTLNWDKIPPLLRLGILEGTILLCIGLTFWLRLDTLSGKIALTSAGLLLGAFLANYGQIYQINADSYKLFLLWALLLTGWVFISKFTPLWLIWFALFYMTIRVYEIQIIQSHAQDERISFWLLLFNGSALYLWEIANIHIDWLKSRWTPRLHALLIAIVLLIPTVNFVVFGIRSGGTVWQIPLAIGFLLIIPTLLFVYSQKIQDFFILVICDFSLMIAFTAWVGNLFNYLVAFFLLTLIFLGQSALLINWLQTVEKSQEV